MQHFCLLLTKQEENGIPVPDAEAEVPGTEIQKLVPGTMLGTSTCDQICTLAGGGRYPPQFPQEEPGAAQSSKRP